MLLHNQTSHPLHWEANGVPYKWDPYGSCDVPDTWRENLRAQGFPVDVSPVTPQRRAEQLADSEREAVARSEIVQLKGKIADAEARAALAAKESEAAQSRAEKAMIALADERAARAVLEEQLRLSKVDVAEYEKLLSEETQKSEALQKQAELSSARQQVDKPRK